MGGEHFWFPNSARSTSGSSPRGRGTLRITPSDSNQVRIIPAWAGNTERIQGCPPIAPDHPRVGGEHRHIHFESFWNDGSSPRGRGTLLSTYSMFREFRIIPAWAGNTGSTGWDGEHGKLYGFVTSCSGSSPRGRGTRETVRICNILFRIIPAWAGNTKRPKSAPQTGSDHPRVGGEHSSCKPLI